MALSFDGVDDTATTPVDLSGTNKITISCALYWNAYANDDDMAFQVMGTDAAGGAYFDPNAALGDIACQMQNDAVNYKIQRWARTDMTAAAWHRIAVLMDRSVPSIALYVDNVLATPTTNSAGGSITATNFGNGTFYMMHRPGTLFGAGRMAEVAIYKSLLSTDEIAALSKGFDPRLVNPASLAFFNPLYGRVSPEPAVVGGAVTLSGPVFTDPPYPIRRPAPALIGA